MAQSPRKFEKVVSHNVVFNYLLGLPQGYDGRLQWPLILFLHGAGERGDNLDVLASQGLTKRLKQGRDVPFIVASPQCPFDRTWENYLSDLIVFLDSLLESYPIKKDQVYLTGLSMGGYGTWSLARLYPERFAAVAPICGGMPWLIDEQDAAQRLKTTPIWAFHGAKDSLVPVEESRVMVEALKAVGGDVRYTEYPELDHDSWTVTYDNPELYTWFLQHKR